MDEENIVRRMINGDMDAFGELMEKYERPALRAAWLIPGTRRTARTLSRRHSPPAI